MQRSLIVTLSHRNKTGEIQVFGVVSSIRSRVSFQRASHHSGSRVGQRIPKHTLLLHPLELGHPFQDQKQRSHRPRQQSKESLFGKGMIQEQFLPISVSLIHHTFSLNYSQ